MTYNKNTINAYVRKMNAEIDHYRRMIKRGEFIAVCISKGNRKIGRVDNVSTAPIICCRNCKECKHCCYDIKACMRYKNVMKARARNTALALYDRTSYFEQIFTHVMRMKKKYFRWHVGGDILDLDYLVRVVAIARLLGNKVFWLYTKNYDIVNQCIAENGPLPSNLHVMYSEWDGVKLVNPYDQPVFSCRLKGGNKNHSDEYFHTLYKCPGNCEACIKAGRGCVSGETAYVDEH